MTGFHTQLSQSHGDREGLFWGMKTSSRRQG